MNIIKLNAIDSTNSYLKKLSNEKELSDFTVVSANFQKNGRGQMGSIWQSTQDKNLTFSILVNFKELSISRRFYISIAVSLGILTTLNNEFGTNFKIKWPNDILADRDKIAGILIENNFRGTKISQTVIGIGLNVNQIKFSNTLQNATSLLILTNKITDKELLLEKLIKDIQYQFQLLKEKKYKELKDNYLMALYGYKQTMNFKDKKEVNFTGKIVGVDEEGKLEIEMENKSIRKFDLKEIKFTNS